MNTRNFITLLDDLDVEIKQAFISLEIILDSEGSEEGEKDSLSKRFISIARCCQELEAILGLKISTMEELVMSISTADMDVFPLRKFVEMKVQIKADAKRNDLEKEDVKRFLQEAKTALCYLFTQYNSIKDIGAELENMYA